MENAAHLKPHGDHLLNYSHVWSTAFVFIGVTSALLARSFSLTLTHAEKKQPELRSRGWSRSMGHG